ncbi:hypothetical protein CD32_07465 [Lysinibacillus odysseyi 34hs-1 = NBRC 100172]|uniref:Uncharacterized protein n=1 Tax=Lysinibacillus odysseyi 34hs-1 = NBRC 100172 TaxID=1220589 RepID=A0A0A3IRZ8_9BACI|nr:hypothetical protein CD32_07465 [Lysinibacillus odysseyi 34hs-1 = NBRC 100172]
MKIKPTKKSYYHGLIVMYQKKTCFFLSKEHLNNEIDFKDVLLMPIDEFYNHSTYGQLKFVNSYGYIKKHFLKS